MDDHGSVGRGPAGEGEKGEPGGLSPVQAFLMLVAVAVVVPLTILATRPGASPTTPPATRTPDFSLTDAEAIAEFERLNKTLMQAYRERNIALAESVFTPHSPMLPRVRKEIKGLIDSSVLSLTRFRPESTVVLSNQPDRIDIERIEFLYPRFRTEAGRDATAGSKPEKRTVEWELRSNGGTWRLHDGVVVERATLSRTENT